jgi:quercetin dioxygenase-like cupin family protein
MKLIQLSDVTAEAVTDEGASGVSIRLLISQAEGAPNFAMRLFEVAPGGHTPFHEHAWEHEVYVVKGPVEVVTEQGPTEANTGDSVLMPPGERHQFRNNGPTLARFLCVIPHPRQAAEDPCR